MKAFVLTIGLIVAASSSASWAQDGATPAGQLLFQMANQHRTEQGLPPLVWDSALARAAKTHAERMSRETGEVQHQYAGEADLVMRASQAGGHFSKVSENIASANTQAADIDQSWMNSPVHRANILDPHVNSVGIGVVEVNGMFYAVEDFAQSNPALSPDAIEAQVQQELRDRGLKVEASDAAKQAARNGCSSSGAAPSGVVAAMQFDCTDLKQFPDILLKAMPNARTHAIAVGACDSKRSSEGFTTYRLAALVY